MHVLGTQYLELSWHTTAPKFWRQLGYRVGHHGADDSTAPTPPALPLPPLPPPPPHPTPSHPQSAPPRPPPSLLLPPLGLTYLRDVVKQGVVVFCPEGAAVAPKRRAVVVRQLPAALGPLVPEVSPVGIDAKKLLVFRLQNMEKKGNETKRNETK